MSYGRQHTYTRTRRQPASQQTGSVLFACARPTFFLSATAAVRVCAWVRVRCLCALLHTLPLVDCCLCCWSPTFLFFAFLLIWLIRFLSCEAQGVGSHNNNNNVLDLCARYCWLYLLGFYISMISYLHLTIYVYIYACICACVCSSVGSGV